jgi:peptide/nickel transport system substrate-binding protein
MKRDGTRSRGRAALAVLLATGVLAAACGGGGGKKSNATSNTTDTTAAVDTTVAGQAETTTTAVGVVPGGAGSSGGATATTAKKSTATTAKKGSTATTAAPKGVTEIKGGITNVTGATTTAPPSGVTPGGTIIWGKTPDIASLDPVKLTHSGSSDGPIAPPLYDMLLYSDPKTGQIIPGTADSLTSTDALTWVLKLHPNIKFSDGTPYDAAAVKFNWARIADPANGAAKVAQASLIASMTVVDPVTLNVVLKAKNATFPMAAIFIPFIASPAAVQAQGSKYGSDANAVGAGPFLLKSWVRDSEYQFVRNPNYWKQPLPYIDQLIVRPIADETQRANTFKSGAVNAISIGTGSVADEVEKSGAGTKQTMILNGGIGLLFNTRRAPFNDVRARLAVGLAIDPVDYAKVVNSNLQEPIDSIFRHDSPFFDSSLVQPFNDKVKAQQLIDQVAAANGGTFAFTITAFSTLNYALSAQYLQAKLNAFKNVKVDILTEASALHITNCTSGNFTGACGTGIIFDDPAAGWTSRFVCDNKANDSGWCNPAFDKAVQTSEQTLNAQERINAIKEAQRVFYSEQPFTWFERRYSWMFTAPNIQNFKFAHDGVPLISEMWIKR